MKIIAGLIFIVAMALLWAVGGEYRFGKGKRGLLLAIPMTALGFFHITWIGLAIQAGILYLIYQFLFYDDGIALVYDKKDPKGWLIIKLNGAMIGLTGCMFGIAGHSPTTIVIGVLAGILGLEAVVKLSNEPQFSAWRAWLSKNGPQYLPYKDDKGIPGHYINFKDAWWVSSALMGAILGIVLVLCLL